jgi:hypothetical protein
VPMLRHRRFSRLGGGRHCCEEAANCALHRTGLRPPVNAGTLGGLMMVAAVRAWVARRRRRRVAIRRALSAFQLPGGARLMGGTILAEQADLVIVRILYLTDHIPPNRAWFAVPDSGSPPSELTFEQVESLESGPWR